MAIFLAVSLAETGETVLTTVDKPYNLPVGIHVPNPPQKWRALLGPFPSRLAARYIWWLWAKRGVKRMTTEIIASAEQAAQDDDDLLWGIERETLLAEAGMTPKERADLYADLAADYDPAILAPVAVAWPIMSDLAGAAR